MIGYVKRLDLNPKKPTIDLNNYLLKRLIETNRIFTFVVASTYFPPDVEDFIDYCCELTPGQIIFIKYVFNNLFKENNSDSTKGDSLLNEYNSNPIIQLVNDISPINEIKSIIDCEQVGKRTLYDRFINEQMLFFVEKVYSLISIENGHEKLTKLKFVDLLMHDHNSICTYEEITTNPNLLCLCALGDIDSQIQNQRSFIFGNNSFIVEYKSRISDFYDEEFLLSLSQNKLTHQHILKMVYNLISQTINGRLWSSAYKYARLIRFAIKTACQYIKYLFMKY